MMLRYPVISFVAPMACLGAGPMILDLLCHVLVEWRPHAIPFPEVVNLLPTSRLQNVLQESLLQGRIHHGFRVCCRRDHAGAALDQATQRQLPQPDQKEFRPKQSRGESSF